MVHKHKESEEEILNWWHHEFCSLPRNLEAEFPAISSCSETQTQLGSGQWSETHQQVHLWMAQNKMKKQTNEGFWVA